MKDRINILVVEDRKKNLEAAKKYFDSRDDVCVKFVTNFEDGLAEIRNNIYTFGIFDLELPKRDGDCPEKLGLELSNEASKYAINWAIVTSGFFHHGNKDVSFVCYEWNEWKDVKQENEGRIEKIHTLKNNPYTWKKVFEELQEKHKGLNLREATASKERFEKFTGKNYSKTERSEKCL